MPRHPGSYDNAPSDLADGLSPMNPDIGHQLSETGSLLTDLDEQAQNVEDGLLAMPLDIARESVLRWADTLRAFGDPKLDRVAATLSELSIAFDSRLEGNHIGTLLGRLGMETRTVALARSGPLGMTLERLADALIFAGASLSRDSN